MGPKRGSQTRKRRLTKIMSKKSTKLPTISAMKEPTTNITAVDPPSASQKTPKSQSIPPEPVTRETDIQPPGLPQETETGNHDILCVLNNLVPVYLSGGVFFDNV